MTPSLPIKSYRPRFHPAPKDDGEGGYKSLFYCEHALVEVFSYTGDARDKPFTTLETYYNDRLHTARLPKWYHPRWHARLARRFDWQISRTDGGIR